MARIKYSEGKEDCEVLLAESTVCVCVLPQVLQGTELASQNKMNSEGAEGRPGGLHGGSV